MQPSMTTFYQDLWLEHIEEASALYEQRTVLITDAELSWLDLEEYEQRIEAHLDALVLGAEPALELCCEQAGSADAGTLYTVICLLCRQDRYPRFVDLLSELDWEDPDICGAFRDALVHEVPKTWLPALGEMCEQRSLDQASLLLSVLARSGENRPLSVVHRLQAEKSAAIALIGALGRLDFQRETPWLREVLATETAPETLAAASRALLRAGDGSVLTILESKAANESWARIPLALAASPGSAQRLSAMCRHDPEPLGIRALGLLGDIRALDHLLALLEHETLAADAALALEWITGAGLYEEVFVPEPFDEDELFEEDIEAVTQGQPVMNPNQQPAGEQVRRLAQDPQLWRPWWQENRARFSAGLRYRNGDPLCPASLLDNLSSEHSAYEIRLLARDELAIRYGHEVLFHLEMRIAEQKSVIAAVGDWVEKNHTRFEAGQWYFQAQQQ